MYTVMLDDQLLYDPRIDDLEILNPFLDIGANRAGGFDFDITSEHPLYNDIQKHKSRIEVFQRGRLLFRGRVLDDEEDFDKIKSIECEGVISFFNDSILPPYDYEGSVRGYLELLISMHNERMGDYEDKKFTVGKITVTDPNDYIVRGNINYPTTWDEINDKLIDILGGSLLLRVEDGVQYIDYLSDSEYMSGQVIEFGENLLDIKRFTKGSDIATAVIPLGERIENEDGEEEGRLTIESVNDGKDYVYDEDAVKIYGGYIFKTVDYPGVTLPENLIQRGLDELKQSVLLGLTIELTAIDMSMLDIDIDDFRVFEYVEVNSPPHDLNALFLVQEMNIHLTDPSQNKIVVGKNFNTLTTSQVSTERSINQIKDEVSTVDNTTRKATKRLEEDVKSINTRTDNYWQTNNVDGDTPNMIAGNKNNHIPPGQKGSNIGGGGSGDYPNQIFGNFSTISGGYQNIVSSPEATIGGGKGNSIYAENSTISGGENGITTAPYGVIGGGRENAVHGQYGSLVGGESNSVNAEHGVIGGGKDNQVSAKYGTVLSGQENQANREHATVVNGRNNYSNSEHATILNGQENEANAHYSTVLNGENNSTTAPYASVLAGRNNSSHAESASILSGEMNEATGKDSAVIGREALSVYPGSLGHGYGKFGEESRAQSHEMKLIRTTTDTNETVLGFDHTDETIYFINRYLGLINLEYLIMAQSTSGVAKVWKFKAFLSNTGNGLEVLNTPTKEVLVETTSNDWDVSLELGEESEWGNRVDIKLNVTGGNEAVHWFADLKKTEIRIPME